MFILALETTGPHASAAVIDEKSNIISVTGEGTMNHLETIVPLTQRLLSQNQMEFSDMDFIAASKGPGSFTGIRIGVSTARALAQASGKHVIGVPTLKAFAYKTECLDFGPEKVICPIFNARRGQIYGGAYSRINGGLVEYIPDGAYTLDEYIQLMRNNRLVSGYFLGDGVDAYREQLDNSFLSVEYAPEEIRYQNAEDVARLALLMYTRGDVIDFGHLKPDYMRKAEAERRLEEGTLGKKKNG